MDFIKSLPISAGKTVIWVIVDRFTKYVHFPDLHYPYTAISLAALFVEQIYKLHVFPKTIVSDKAKTFLSNFWQTLFKQVGTQICLSTSYHSQIDGRSEKLNRCLEGYLRCMCNLQLRKWCI